MAILELAESYKTINQPGPTVTLFDGLYLESIKDKDVNFDTIFIQVFSSCYKYLRSISVIV